MNKIFKSQDLTPEQYHRCHNVMTVILTISYVLFIGIEFINNKNGIAEESLYRTIFYGVSTVLLYLNLTVNKYKKMGMLVYALSFIIVYTIAA